MKTMHGCCHPDMSSIQRHGGMHGEDQCHGTSAGIFRRNFFSPAEELEMLQKYIENLKHELAGAEARLAELS